MTQYFNFYSSKEVESELLLYFFLSAEWSEVENLSVSFKTSDCEQKRSQRCRSVENTESEEEAIQTLFTQTKQLGLLQLIRLYIYAEARCHVS